MVNATLSKFGYPGTLIKNYHHWSVLLRPQQITLASLVLAAKSEATAFGSLPPGAHAELAAVTADIESHLKYCFDYDRINYLMLMMVDPHVHLHVVPRYADERNFAGVMFQDQAWPGPPDLKTVHALSDETRWQLLSTLKQRFSGAG